MTLQSSTGTIPQDVLPQLPQQTWPLSLSGQAIGSSGRSNDIPPFSSVEASSLASAIDPIDGMGAVSEQEDQTAFHGESDNMIPTSPKTEEYIGPSSNVPFSRCILHMVARVNNIDEPWSPALKQGERPTDIMNHNTSLARNATSYHFPNPHTQLKDASDKYHFPSDETVQPLLKVYFSDVGTLFPYIHEATFRENYASFRKRDPRNCRPIWLGLLNMILAVAKNSIHRNDSSVNEWTTEAQTYYRRAVSICDRYILGGSTLENGRFPLTSSYKTKSNPLQYSI